MFPKIVLNNIFKNIESVISIISRIINAATFYFLTFLSSRYLTSDDFAKWTLFITFINLLPLFNFGISTGLVNKMASNNSVSENNQIENHNLVNASFKFQFIVSFFLILLMLIISLLNYNYNNTLVKLIIENKFSIMILFISLPFQFYSSILYSYKQINLSNYISIIQNVILFIGSFIIYLLSKNLNIFILYYSITYTILFLIFFKISIKKNKINLNLNFKNLNCMKKICNSSFSFWIMSFFSNLLSTAQVFFVSFFFGLKSVPDFFLFQRLFSIINTFHLAFLSPYTVKFIGMASTNNWSSLNNLIKYLSKKFTIILYLTLGLFVFLFHPMILKIWTHQTIKDYNSAIIFFSIFLITSIGNVYSVFLNSLGHFKIQIIFSIISFISFFLFLSLFRNSFGAISVALASIPSAFITLILMIRHTNKVIFKNEILI